MWYGVDGMGDLVGGRNAVVHQVDLFPSYPRGVIQPAGCHLALAGVSTWAL